MKRRTIKLSVLFLFILLTSMLFTACGNSPSDAVNQPTESIEQSATEQQANEEQPSFVTEEDFRNALSSATGEQKLALYRDFAANYRMQEDEYIEYAALCEQAGDMVSQRRALMSLYKLDPTEAHGELLAAMTLQITPADDAHAEGLLQELAELIGNCNADDFDVETLRAFVDTEDWKGSFYIDNGTFTSNTAFESDTLSATVSSDQFVTTATIISADTEYMCEISYEGVKAAYLTKSAGVYAYHAWGEENADALKVNGSLQDGHFTDAFDATIDGKTYHGTFDEAGKTKEEQPKGFTGTVYAYADNGKDYLYVEEADPAEWVATPEELGFGSF